MTIYADSSFFVSRYVQDAHSTETDRRMARLPRIWLTPFHKAEVTHAIFQHVFQKVTTIDRATLAWNAFEQDSATGIWAFTTMPARALEITRDLGRRFGATLAVRTLDSLHVACALELKAQRFWTFDDRQAKLAEAVGLDTTA